MHTSSRIPSQHLIKAYQSRTKEIEELKPYNLWFMILSLNSSISEGFVTTPKLSSDTANTVRRLPKPSSLCAANHSFAALKTFKIINGLFSRHQTTHIFVQMPKMIRWHRPLPTPSPGINHCARSPDDRQMVVLNQQNFRGQYRDKNVQYLPWILLNADFVWQISIITVQQLRYLHQQCTSTSTMIHHRRD